VTRILVVCVATVVAATGLACNREKAHASAVADSLASRSGQAAGGATAQSLALNGTSTCDTLARLIKVPAVQLLAVARDSSLRDPMSDTRGWRRGCIIAMKDPADTTGAPMQPLEQWFTSHGWEYAPYSADGPDGEVFGYTDFHRLCVVRGSWDGGDDSDTTYVPAPGYELWVMCAPATPEDSVGYGKRHREELDMRDALARPRIGGAIVCPVPDGCGIAPPSIAPTSMADLQHLVAAARLRTNSWPTAPAVPQVDTVARHGRAIARAIVAMLPTDSTNIVEWNVHVEQQLELTLCAIFDVKPEAGKTVWGADVGQAANRTVRKFWRDRVLHDGDEVTPRRLLPR
jgi:hypothetical protein